MVLFLAIGLVGLFIVSTIFRQRRHWRFDQNEAWRRWQVQQVADDADRRLNDLIHDTALAMVAHAACRRRDTGQ